MYDKLNRRDVSKSVTFLAPPRRAGYKLGERAGISGYLINQDRWSITIRILQDDKSLALSERIWIKRALC